MPARNAPTKPRRAIRHLSWQTRRNAKRALTWIVFVLAGTAYSAWHIPADEAAARLHSQLGVPDIFAGQIIGAANLIVAPVSRAIVYVTGHPAPDLQTYILSLAVGIIIAGFFVAKIEPWLHDHLFASFNDDVLIRVTTANRPDRDDTTASSKFVDLAWTLGSAGPRHDAFSQLLTWTDMATSSDTKLSLATLVGRAGSGKTRMAFELALYRAHDPAGTNPRRRASRRWRLWARIRRIIVRHPEDRWDTGYVKYANSGELEFKQAISRLATWRPRRPTLLWLDDPLSSRTGDILDVLSAAKPLPHPVRILITNQTVPNDAGLTYDLSSSLWRSGREPADPQPIKLPMSAWFTEHETNILAFTTLGVQPTAVAQSIRDHLYRATAGNPLLVELAIEFLRGGEPPDHITEVTISTARAERIGKGLDSHAIKDFELLALALATLLGGITDAILRPAWAAIYPHHPLPQPRPETYQACFPTERIGTAGTLTIPPVRPDLVGDAFVDLAIRTVFGFPAGARLDRPTQAQIDCAQTLLGAAFRLNPGTMLRTIRRPRHADSPMHAALAAFNPATITGIDPIDIALAYADIAAICQPDDRPLSTAESRAANLANARATIAPLDAAQRLAFCAKFAALCTIPPDQPAPRQLRPDLAMRVINQAADHPDVLIPPETWLTFFAALRRRAQGTLVTIDAMIKTAAAIPSLPLADRLADAAWDMGPDWRAQMLPLFDGLATAAERLGASLAAKRFAAMAVTVNPDAAHAVAEQTRALAAANPADPTAQLTAAQAIRHEVIAWCQVPAGAQALNARAAADIVHDIAARFPDDPPFQREAAEARSCEAFAWCQVPAGAQAPNARAAADIVRDIAARFPDDPAIQKQAADARRIQAFAWCQVPAGAQAPNARAAADIVRDIAARFPDDPAIQREAAEARSCEAFAWCQVPAGAQAPNARAAADIVRDIAARFPDDPAIQREAAEARRNEAFAWSQVPAGAQAPNARAAAAIVRDIAARFPDDPAIQKEAAIARRNEAFAWSQVPAGAQAPNARAAAAIVRDIAARFPDDPAIQKEAAIARRHEAFAWCQVPAGAQAPNARAAAAIVRDIAARFPDDPAIQKEAAIARRNEAFAWCQVPAGAQALNARAAADIVRDIAARFPDDPASQKRAAEARRNEAFAWSQVPAGAQAPNARAAAAIVRDIAARFPDDPAIQKEAAIARRHEAFAWCQVPAGAQAPNARAAADIVRDIAARFPDDPAIQREAAEARSCEAFAWCQVPAGAQALNARAAADIVRDIAARFPDDPAIQNEAAEANRFADHAERNPKGK